MRMRFNRKSKGQTALVAALGALIIGVVLIAIVVSKVLGTVDHTDVSATASQAINDTEEVGYDALVIAGLGALVIAAVFILRTLRGAT